MNYIWTQVPEEVLSVAGGCTRWGWGLRRQFLGPTLSSVSRRGVTASDSEIILLKGRDSHCSEAVISGVGNSSPWLLTLISRTHKRGSFLPSALPWAQLKCNVKRCRKLTQHFGRLLALQVKVDDLHSLLSKRLLLFLCWLLFSSHSK